MKVNAVAPEAYDLASVLGSVLGDVVGDVDMKTYNKAFEQTPIAHKAQILALRIKVALFYLRCYLVLAAGVVKGANPASNLSADDYALAFYNKVLALLDAWFDIKVQLEGLEHIPKGGCVALANHQSSLETVILQGVFSPMSTVLKKELLAVPILGSALKRVYPIALDRSTPTSAYKSLLRKGRARLKLGRSVLIFPEGTRVPAGQRKRFNRGGAALAKSANALLVPVAHNAGCFWPPSVGTQAKSAGSRFVKVVIGPAFDTRDIELDDLHQQSEAWINRQVQALEHEAEAAR